MGWELEGVSRAYITSRLSKGLQTPTSPPVFRAVRRLGTNGVCSPKERGYQAQLLSVLPPVPSQHRGPVLFCTIRMALCCAVLQCAAPPAPPGHVLTAQLSPEVPQRTRHEAVTAKAAEARPLLQHGPHGLPSAHSTHEPYGEDHAGAAMSCTAQNSTAHLERLSGTQHTAHTAARRGGTPGQEPQVFVLAVLWGHLDQHHRRCRPGTPGIPGIPRVPPAQLPTCGHARRVCRALEHAAFAQLLALLLPTGQRGGRASVRTRTRAGGEGYSWLVGCVPFPHE